MDELGFEVNLDPLLKKKKEKLSSFYKLNRWWKTLLKHFWSRITWDKDIVSDLKIKFKKQLQR